MIEIHTKIDSDQLTIEGLGQFIGKEVDILISENLIEKKYPKFFQNANNIEIDEDSIRNLRENSTI